MSTANDRGRGALTPTTIPGSGWWDVAKRVLRRLGDANLGMLSAGVAFFAVLAIFPALSAIVSLYALLADPSHIQGHLVSLSRILPDDVTRIFTEQLTALSQRANQTLGAGLLISVSIAIWSAHRGVAALVRAVTVAYRENETRSFIHLTVVTYLLTAASIVLVVLTLALMLGIPAVFVFLPLPNWIRAATGLTGWVLFVGMSALSFALLYRFAPPRRSPKWQWLSPGALVGTLLWIISSTAFSVYVSQFGTYNETYGTLSAIMVLLIWFYVTCLSVVLGAILNAELEYQTAKDTTVGQDKKMGERDAFVADHLSPPG